MTDLNISVSINNVVVKIKCKTEVKTNLVKKMEDTCTYYSSYPQDETNLCATNKNELEKLNVDLISATNYLILLFFKSGQKYTCSRTKIGKLLTIVAFTYAVEKKLLFNEKVYKYGNCGTAINEILDKYDRDIYISNPIDDNEQTISFGDKTINDLDESIKREYGDNLKLDISVKRRIDDVFIKFGSYSASRLGDCINCIINIDDIIINDEVQFENLYLLSQNKDLLDKISDLNPLVRYVFSI